MLLGVDAIKKFRLIQNENLKIFQRINSEKATNLQEDRSYNDQKTPYIRSNDIQTSTLDNVKELDNYLVESNLNKSINPYEFNVELQHIENEEQKGDILQLIKKYRHTFAKDKFDIGQVRSKEAEIKLLRNEYVTCRPYKCSIPDDEQIRS